MKTHYLDFKDGNENHRIKCTEQMYTDVMTFWKTNPSYQQKLSELIEDTVSHKNFTMADFTGRSGKLSSNFKLHVAALPESEEELEKRREMVRKFREANKNKPWASKNNQPKDGQEK